MNTQSNSNAGSGCPATTCSPVGKTATIINGPKSWIGVTVEITIASKFNEGPPAFGHTVMYCQNQPRRFYQWVPKCWLEIHGENDES